MQQPTPEEIWAEPEPPMAMVHAICNYVQHKHPEFEKCLKCKTVRPDGTQTMCYGMAAETCRVVTAMQKKLKT